MMDRQLKQRVVGAGLLVAFGVIFIPIFLDNGGVESPVPPTMNIPPAPTEDVSARAPALGEEAIAAMEARADEDVELPPPRAQAGEGSEAEPSVDTPSAGGEPPAAVETLEEGVAAPAPNAPEEPAVAPLTPARMLPPPPPRNAPVRATPTPAKPAPVKPPPLALVASKPAPVTVTGWTVQLGSFASDVNARKLVDKLKAAGYKAYSEPRIEQHVTVFKVRVGPTPGKAEAERLRQRIEAQFEARGMLVPSR
jgi:DedD protein